MSETDDADLPDLETLARRYLDLWQDQWTALAADPDMAEMTARLFQQMGQAVAAMNPFAPFAAAAAPDPAGQRANGHGAGSMVGPPVCALAQSCPLAALGGAFAGAGSGDETPDGAAASGDAAGERERTDHHAADASAATGAPSACAASGGGAEYLAQLLGRLAYLEKRVVALEAGAARPRYRARKGRPQE